ncbi:MAG: PIN domain-containing protein [Ignavibacteriae bacterium]|nr:PIN domain-containing protein [Ignavibacteriota bacterium]NOH00103.1 PIN domain-containing protein [Ignavibacteriota bacterium]
MKILVDSSVWIDFFRGGNSSKVLEGYIDDNLICTNDLILAELIPHLVMQKQKKLIALLNLIEKIPIIINWSRIIESQTKCLKNGINKVGIPDLIILQNAIDNELNLFSFDKHFKLISKFRNSKLVLISPK